MSLGSNYEDTIRSLKTGKEESSFEQLKRYINWGGSNDELPYNNKGAPTGQNSGLLTWPPWTSATELPPFYEHFGMSTLQRYIAFALCILGASFLFFLVYLVKSKSICTTK